MEISHTYHPRHSLLLKCDRHRPAWSVVEVFRQRLLACRLHCVGSESVMEGLDWRTETGVCGCGGCEEENEAEGDVFGDHCGEFSGA